MALLSTESLKIAETLCEMGLPDFLGQILKKIVITLQILRFKQNCLRQS